jgi:hypothetical protein
MMLLLVTHPCIQVSCHQQPCHLIHHLFIIFSIILLITLPHALQPALAR